MCVCVVWRTERIQWMRRCFWHFIQWNVKWRSAAQHIDNWKKKYFWDERREFIRLLWWGWQGIFAICSDCCIVRWRWKPYTWWPIKMHTRAGIRCRRINIVWIWLGKSLKRFGLHSHHPEGQLKFCGFRFVAGLMITRTSCQHYSSKMPIIANAYWLCGRLMWKSLVLHLRYVLIAVEYRTRT